MKKLTVLMPTYNAEEFISEAIESVLMQKTDFEYELYIIDDKSTDKSLEIAKQYQQKHPNKIKILTNEKNLRLLSTIIKGYEQAKTEYFCVLDPDDYYITEDKLQKAIDFLDKNPEFTIYFSNSYILKDGIQEKYLNVTDEEKVFDIDDLLNNRLMLGHTTGSIFRNVEFKEDIPNKLYKIVNTESEISFRGDTFRNYLHLIKGKAYFKNDIEAVYRMTERGIWASLPIFKRNLINSQMFYDFYNFFDDEILKKTFARQSFAYFKEIEKSITECFSLENETFKPINKDLFDMEQLNKLFAFYFENKMLLTEKNQAPLEDDVAGDFEITEDVNKKEEDTETKEEFDEKNNKINFKNKIRLYFYKKLRAKLIKYGLIDREN